MAIGIQWGILLIFRIWWKLRERFIKSTIVKSVHLKAIPTTTSTMKMTATTNHKFKTAHQLQININRQNTSKFLIKIKKRLPLKRGQIRESSNRVTIIHKMKQVGISQRKMKGMEKEAENVQLGLITTEVVVEQETLDKILRNIVNHTMLNSRESP